MCGTEALFVLTGAWPLLEPLPFCSDPLLLCEEPPFEPAWEDRPPLPPEAVDLEPLFCALDDEFGATGIVGCPVPLGLDACWGYRRRCRPLRGGRTRTGPATARWLPPWGRAPPRTARLPPARSRTEAYEIP